MAQQIFAGQLAEMTSLVEAASCLVVADCGLDLVQMEGTLAA